MRKGMAQAILIKVVILKKVSKPNWQHIVPKKKNAKKGGGNVTALTGSALDIMEHSLCWKKKTSPSTNSAPNNHMKKIPKPIN